MDKKVIQQNLTSKQPWLRAPFMLLFLVIYHFARILLYFIVAGQFLVQLFTGGPNANLLKFGKSLSVFVYDIMLYLTYNSEKKPYPFGDWPS